MIASNTRGAKWGGVFMVVVLLITATVLPQSETADGSSREESVQPLPGEARQAEGTGTAVEKGSDHFSKRLAKDFFQDQKAIWTSPSRIQKSDLKWLLPLAIGTAAVLSVDTELADQLDGGAFHVSHALSDSIANIGGPTNFVTATALFGLGRLREDERMSETGLLALSAVGSTWATVQVLKQATNRERPDRDDHRGKFWGGGASFPSGHSASTWALATVVAQRYPEKRFLKVGLYGLAVGVSSFRFTGHNHFVSDVIVGGVIGHLIGRYVVRHKK